jgi:filamentous hemagglutinin family protein
MTTKFWLSFLTSISLVATTQTTRAQTYQPSNRIPVADSTLGTQVSGTGNNFNITGGINKGQTLFHSFTDFSVPTNGAANFLNPANNRDIITRVTGGVFSDINGLLNSNGANFFLINPNGIVFGTNAQLNVGKAFVGSTASSFDLVDGSGRMITFGANPNGDAPLLSVAPNVLFNVSRLNFTGNAGAINNFGTLQTPNNGQYIGLIGGNVTLDGSSGGGKIVAPGGRVDIGGLSGAGSVSVDNNGLVFSSVGVGRSNVLLTDGAGITVRATGTLDTVNTFFNNATANGSSLNISANNLALLDAGAISATLPAAIDAGLETNSGVQTKAAGNINIDATGKVSLNNSAIKNTLRSGSEGSIGDLKIRAGAVDINNSIISTVAAGKGNAGNVTVTAKDAVSLTDDGIISSQVLAGGVGKGGTIDINAGSLSIINGAQLSASSFGTGNAGNVSVTAKDAVSLAGNSSIFSTVEAGSVGKGGTININAGSLSIADGAQVLTSTRSATATQPAGQGDAGNVTVQVAGAVDIAGFGGTSIGGIRSEVDAGATGNGGNIAITAGTISLREGAEIAASSFGTGNAGNVLLTAKDAVSLTGYSYVLSKVEAGGVGNGGNIEIEAGSLSLRDRAKLQASSFGTGNAGNVTVTAKDAVDLTGNSYIFSTVGIGSVGNGGNITVDTGSLSVRDDAQLEASTYGRGNAGNVTVTAKDAISLINGDIFSTVEAGGVGKGGSIDISARTVSLTDGAQLQTITRGASATQPAGAGAAGNVTLKVAGAVDIAGSDGTFFSGIRSAVETGTTGNGGNITIGAGSVSMRDGAELTASTFGRGNAGNVSVTAKDAVSLVGNSYIFSTVQAGGVGKGGTIKINAGSLSMADGAQVVTNTRSATATQPAGQGDAGNVTVQVAGAVDIAGFGGTFYGGIRSEVDAGATGNGGNIAITAGTISLREGAEIASSSFGTGNAGNVLLTAKDAVSLTNYSYVLSKVEAGGVGNGGNIEIEAGSLSLQDSAKLQASTYGTGNAGNVTVTAKDAVSLSNGDIFSTVEAGGVGKGGSIDISARTVSLTDSAQLQTITRRASATQPAGQGDAGNVTLKVAGAVDIAGSDGTFFSGIRSEVATGTTGNGGNITIGAGSISLRDGAQLVASTFGTGNAGNVLLTAKDAVSLTDYSYILSKVEAGGVGNGGNIEIEAGSLSLQDRAKLQASTYGMGNAGNITVTAKDAVSLINGNIFSTVEVGGVGKGGSIDITAGSVSLKDGGKLTASTYGIGNAGDVSVKTTGDINISGSDSLATNPTTSSIAGIISNTNGQGDAGKIIIDTQGKLSMINNGRIFSSIASEGVGNSQGISIAARELEVTNNSFISTGTIQSALVDGKGNAGDINIKTTGDIKISGYDSSTNLSALDTLPEINSATYGQGSAGKITIDTQGNLVLTNRGGIANTIGSTSLGNSKGISISAKDISVTDGTIESSNFGGTGTAGNIDIKSTGNFTITGTNDRSLLQGDKTIAISSIESSTTGKGDAGKITIDSQGNLSIANRAGIFNSVNARAVGNSQGVNITTKDLNVANFGYIQSGNYGGVGTAGNINIKSTGNINISGTVDRQSPPTLTSNSEISSATYGEGNAGKVTIETTGKLSLSNQAKILSTIEQNAIGNSEGIKISAGEVEMANISKIDASTFGIGKAGNIEIVTTGKYTADNASTILAVTTSEGDAGNITLNAKSVTLTAGSELVPLSIGKGKAGNLTVTTPRDGFINITGTAPSGKLSDGNQGGFSSGLFASAEKESSNVAGKISVTTGTLNIDNGGAISTRTRTNTAPVQPNNPQSSIVDGKYPAEPGVGSIFIDANNINMTGGGQILTTSTGNAPAGDVILKNANTKLAIAGNDPSYESRKAALIAAFPDIPEAVATVDPISQYSGIFANNGVGATGKGGTILLNPFSVKIADGGQISVNNQGTGEGGNIFLVSNLVTLNSGKISADSANTTGGNITLTTSDYLLLRNGSEISTNSGSSGKNGNGGNITISSPALIALPGNNDITANAYNGAGGQVSITSQGLFGINYRDRGSPLSNDITASSTFGQSGAVKITTPGTDPGRDSTELPKVTTDASNQISQACSANNRQNKLTVAGRGGLPPNANDLLTTDVVWQDARATSSQPAVSSVNTPVKFAPPAVGWVFDGKGKVTLVAAGTQGEPTGTSVVCPK